MFHSALCLRSITEQAHRKANAAMLPVHKVVQACLPGRLIIVTCRVVSSDSGVSWEGLVDTAQKPARATSD